MDSHLLSNVFAAHFEELVKKCLKGEGHLPGNNALLSNTQEFKNTKTFRLIALLEVATGLPLRLASNFWETRVCLFV